MTAESPPLARAWSSTRPSWAEAMAATIDNPRPKPLNYGWSILHCLAVGMMDADSAGTGTVIRPDTVGAYASEAGFARVDVLPIDHDFWRFYRLVS